MGGGDGDGDAERKYEPDIGINMHAKKPSEIAYSFRRSKGYGIEPRIGAGIGSTLATHGHHPVETSRSMIYSDAVDSAYETGMSSL